MCIDRKDVETKRNKNYFREDSSHISSRRTYILSVRYRNLDRAHVRQYTVQIKTDTLCHIYTRMKGNIFRFSYNFEQHPKKKNMV